MLQNIQEEFLGSVYQQTRKEFKVFVYQSFQVNLQSRPERFKLIMNYEQRIQKYSKGKRAVGVPWKQDLEDCNVYELLPESNVDNVPLAVLLLIDFNSK